MLLLPKDQANVTGLEKKINLENAAIQIILYSSACIIERWVIQYEGQSHYFKNNFFHSITLLRL